MFNYFFFYILHDERGGKKRELCIAARRKRIRRGDDTQETVDFLRGLARIQVDVSDVFLTGRVHFLQYRRDPRTISGENAYIVSRNVYNNNDIIIIINYFIQPVCRSI